MENIGSVIWITWERQLRNKSMSSLLGVELFEITSQYPKLFRYFFCAIKTVWVVFKEKPSLVICQNPSTILTYFLLLIKKLFRFRLVVDAHFGGIDARHKNRFLQIIINKINNKADLIIVTNENHASVVRELGGRAFICPDPLPALPPTENAPIEDKKVFLICSYDPDEPFGEVFKAADLLLTEGFRLAVSGKYQKAAISPQDYPHVEMLGFVPEDVFYRHLFTSQIAIDLTDNDDCLVCGAYEALEAGKPLVLSKKKALQDYFTGGTVFTENKAEEIANAIRIAYAKREELAGESRRWVLRAKEEMAKRMTELKGILASL